MALVQSQQLTDEKSPHKQRGFFFVTDFCVNSVLGETRIASLSQIPQRRDQCINFLASVIEGEGGTKRALEAKAAQDRLCAVVTAANRDALGLSHLTYETTRTFTLH